MSLRHGAGGGHDVGDALGVEDRNGKRPLHVGGKAEEGGDREGHVGKRNGMRHVITRLPADHVDEIDQAELGVTRRDLDAFCRCEPLLEELIARHAHTDDVIVSHPLADRLEHFDSETHPVLEASAIFIAATIGRGAPELVDEMAVGAGDLHPVETALLGAAHRLGEGAADARHVLALHRLGDRAMRGLAFRGGGQGGQPMLDIPARAPSHVGELDHQRRPVAVDALGEGLEMRDDPVIGDRDLIPRRGGAIGGDRGGAAEHGQGQPALGFLFVIELITKPRPTAFTIARGVRRAHDPVAQGERLEAKRLKQGGERLDHEGRLDIPSPLPTDRPRHGC